MRLDRSEPEENGLNLTPLIDVVFLLLIFFLSATTFSREEVEMELELPESRSGQAQEGGKPLVINIDRQGRLLVDGRDVSEAALRQKLQAAAARDRNQEILIRGDTQARFGLVARVFDACLLARLHAISIGATEAGLPEGEGR